MAFEKPIPIMTDGAGDQASEQKKSKRSFAVAPSPRATRRGQDVAQGGNECTGHGFRGEGPVDKTVMVCTKEAFKLALRMGNQGRRERIRGRVVRVCGSVWGGRATGKIEIEKRQTESKPGSLGATLRLYVVHPATRDFESGCTRLCKL